MGFRRQRHDDAHFPRQGKGRKAERSRASGAAALQLLKEQPAAELYLVIPKTDWQRLMLRARRRYQAGLFIGLSKAVSRQTAIAQIRQEILSKAVWGDIVAEVAVGR